MIFDARDIARGWLAVALASAQDSAWPALNRTIYIESYGDGARLVSTDSVTLLHTWVPAVDHHGDPGPSLDEAPQKTAIAMDPHGRARGFLKHALKLAIQAAKDELDPVEIRLRLDVAENDGARAQATFAGMEARYVVLEQPDHERLKLRTCEGEYPSWRKLLAGFEPELTTQLALAPDVIAQLGKLGRIHPGCRVGWSFGGGNQAARLTIIESDPHVDGMVMPCRWDIDANAPRVDDVVAEAEKLAREAAEAPPDDDPDGDEAGEG